MSAHVVARGLVVLLGFMALLVLCIPVSIHARGAVGCIAGYVAVVISVAILVLLVSALTAILVVLWRIA